MSSGSQFCPAALGRDSCEWKARTLQGSSLSAQESIDQLVETGPGNWTKSAAEDLLEEARMNRAGI